MRRRDYVILCAALAVGCGEPLSPNEVAGRYGLERVAGDTLPALLFENEWVSIRAFADTLVFRADGRGTRISVQEFTPPIDSARDLQRWETGFSYSIEDGRIEVGYDCPPNADCVAPPHLVLRRTSSGLRADFALGYRVPLTYGRVASVGVLTP